MAADPETPAAATEPALPPLRSVHTSNLADILQQLGISLLVTTYQAGKMVVVRADGGSVNTHFRNFNKPMGLAVLGDRLAIGTATDIGEFHNVRAVAARLEPVNRHDACLMPRLAHATGDIQIHEMAWVAQGDAQADPELWFINTRFSCLCTRSPTYSFVPRWRPRFISAYSPEDRCHLNGLATRNGQIRYVTALGETDTAGGWRANKKDGGLLIDVPSNEIILRGLSMPHSPRWVDERLWILESGSGGFGVVDNGRYRELTRLPGFTRGMDFAGPLAFIGLSQVRESAVFSGIAIAERPLAERSCGVWVVHRETGQTVAFLKFEDAVQEIFAVQVVPWRYPDLINDNAQLLADSFVLPDDALADVPEALRRLDGGLPPANST